MSYQKRWQIFGPKKLPEIGKSLGKTLKGFQDASKEFQDEFKKEAQKIEETVSMNAQLESGKETEVVVFTSVSLPDSNWAFIDTLLVQM